MTIDVIHVQIDDTVSTVIGKIQSASTPYCLLEIPMRMKLLSEPVQLAHLKTVAQQYGVKVGIKTNDPLVRSAARSVNIPLYWTKRFGTRRLQKATPWWMRPKRSYEGSPTAITSADKRVARRRMKVRPRWWRFIKGYVRTLLFIATMGILALALYSFVPQASIVLRPDIQPISVTIPVLVDPNYNANVADEFTIPGRLLITAEKWQATVPATTYKEIPKDRARGIATFVNIVPQEVEIPAGTRVSTSTGERIVFQTVQVVTAPAKIGGEVSVEIEAVEAGESGNLPADRLNRIEGPLDIQLNVRNLTNIGGGTMVAVPTTNQKDRDRLREHVFEKLEQQAMGTMKQSLREGEFMVNDSVRLIALYHETYSHFIGEETEELTLEIRAEYHATAVDEEIALNLVYEQLDEYTPEGFKLDQSTISPRLGELRPSNAYGQVPLDLIGEAVSVAEFSLAEHKEEITGQPISVSRGYLDENLPLREIPEIEVWPTWMDNIPRVGARISFHVEIPDFQNASE